MARSKPAARSRKALLPKGALRKKAIRKTLREVNRRYGKMLSRLS